MSFSLTEKAAFQLWEQLDCSTSLRCAILARHGQWAEVLTLKVEPGNFVCPFEYAKANAAVTFLKKHPGVPGSSREERQKRALATWMAGEASCYHTNERLQRFVTSPLSGDVPAVFLRRVSRRLLGWLGPCPDDSELKRRARHGPGTTFSSSVANPTAADKYDDSMTLTPDAVWHLANIVGTKWGALTASSYGQSGDKLKFVRGNRFTTVPKTAITDRCIAIEGSLNIYFQLAVGNAIRSRMRKHMWTDHKTGRRTLGAGWDLDNAAPIHREVARKASIDGSFATIDLTNASDSLAKNLVKVLLGHSRWWALLDDLRSKRTQINGKWHLLEKFSSMGNGYTFELESCIFAAICAECLVLKGHQPILGHNLFVFGDDIIVPTDTAELVVDTLQWLGFQANKEKTFLHGSFRESCGGDFFLGSPVRGFYLKAELSNVNPSDLFTLHNGAKVLLENCKVNPFDYLEWIRSLIPKALRELGGSPRLGDSVLHGVEPKFRWRSGIRWVRAVRWSKPVLIRWNYFSEEARLACRLTGYGHTFGIDSRGLIRTREVIWVSDS